MALRSMFSHPVEEAVVWLERSSLKESLSLEVLLGLSPACLSCIRAPMISRSLLLGFDPFRRDCKASEYRLIELCFLIIVDAERGSGSVAVGVVW